MGASYVMGDNYYVGHYVSSVPEQAWLKITLTPILASSYVTGCETG